MRPSTLVGLIGTNLKFSSAPAVHMEEGWQNGLSCIYRLIDFAALNLTPNDLPDVVLSMERLSFDGLAVTHPFKEAIIPLLTELSPEATLLGAVNTVILRDGKRVGHNTDWLGFFQAFKRGMANLKSERVALLGAGGAGKAVAHGLLSAGVARVDLVLRNPQKAEMLINALSAVHGSGRIVATSEAAAALLQVDGLVNATPLGMESHPGMPVPNDCLRSDMWVYDVIYGPKETALLQSARQLGATAIDGSAMFLFQAAEQIRLFTGVAPDTARMFEFFTSTRVSGADEAHLEPTQGKLT